MEMFYALSVERNLIPFVRELNDMYNLGINTVYPILYEDDPAKQEQRTKGFLKAIWAAKIRPLPYATQIKILKIASKHGIAPEDFR
jgi:hypothetical protein